MPDKRNTEEFEMSPTTNDDLYVNEGSSYDQGEFYPDELTPEEKEKQAAEDGAKAASYPIISDVDDWFGEQIANCIFPENIMTKAVEINGAKVDMKVSIEGQVLAYQMLKELLIEKRNDFMEFAKRMRDE